MELNCNNKCRACLAENDAMLSLFEVYEHDLTLAVILQSCLPKEVSEDDGMPSHLCDSCILVLTQFYNFTIVYEESENQLRSLVKKCKNIIPVNESEELQEDLNVVNVHTEEEAFGSETSGLLSSDSNEQLLLQDDESNGMVSVEVNEEAVIINCNDQDNLEFYEFKNVIDEQQETNNAVAYDEVQELEPIHEFKKEAIPADELSNDLCSNDNDYLEIHISDGNEPSIKEEDDVFKRENPMYEEIKKYECTVCGEAHLYAASFQQHMRIKHHMLDINCEDYASRIRIKINQKIDAPHKRTTLSQKHVDKSELPYKCKFCDKKFHLVSHLQQHSKLHDANKKYVCEVCGARFIRKTYLDDHMEGHSTNKNHVCKFCGKAFRRRTVLRAHKRVHTHPNYYVCELCGRAFTNSSTLKTHKLLIHVRERNFKCVICNLTFPLKSTLNKHVLRHQKRENGEKGFNCPQCEMQYRDKSSLKRHIETKHQGRVQLISCPDCPKKYTSKANLMKHRRRHHEPPDEDLT